jgi:hypothetical protein
MADPYDLLSLQAEFGVAVDDGDEARLRRLAAELFAAIDEGRLGGCEVVRILEETGAAKKLDAFMARRAGKPIEEDVARRAVWGDEAGPDEAVPKAPRKPPLGSLIKQAELAGKTVTGSVTTRDGHTLTYGAPTAKAEAEPTTTADNELARWRRKHAR